MEVTTLESCGTTISFSLTGQCPHCSKQVACTMVGPPVLQDIPQKERETKTRENAKRIAAITKCAACGKFVLAVVIRMPHPSSPGQPSSEPFDYEAHYPIGCPDESVEDAIPPRVGKDLKEALRCQFVEAFNATAEMCRRAIEASCIHLRVPTSLHKLDEKIDWLVKEGIITPFLGEVAHKIRLGGNRGAHPPEETSLVPPPEITSEHADAIITFTKEYLHHVYTVRKMLDSFDFSRTPAKTQP